MPLLSSRGTVLFTFLESLCVIHLHLSVLFLNDLLWNTSKPSLPTLLGRLVFCDSEPDIQVLVQSWGFSWQDFNVNGEILIS